jgi:hypothetical protein
MKKSLSCLVAVLLVTVAVSSAGPDKAAIEAKENAAWQAFKDKNADAFQKVVDKDIRCAYDVGINKMSDELNDMKNADIKSFKLTDFDSFSDEKDVIVTTYKVDLQATQNGQDISGNYNSGSVWKLENGQWMAIFHTMVKAAAAK